MTKRLEFTRKTKEARLAHSGELCEAIWDGARCNMPLTPGQREYHHEVEAERGGDNSFDNCRAVCVKCHKKLTALFVMAKAKAERQRAGQMNSKPSSPRPLPADKNSPVKAAIGGGVKPRVRPPPKKPPLPFKPLYVDIDERKAS